MAAPIAQVHKKGAEDASRKLQKLTREHEKLTQELQVRPRSAVGESRCGVTMV